MDRIRVLKSSPDKKDPPKAQDPTTVVPDNKNAPPLEDGHSTKHGGMWILKHEIRSQKFYEILIKTLTKGGTDLDLKNFYNHINMCLNAMNRLIKYLLTSYQSIKRHSEF